IPGGKRNPLGWRREMARVSRLEKMSYRQLAATRLRIDQLIAAKQNSEREALRKKMAAMAKQPGFDPSELVDGRSGKGRGAPTYTGPRNPATTWTGRGRMPLWMVAALEDGKASKEDFLI